MRVCIVGCGAVGSLFAANLATLDDVEVWAFDLYQAHVDAIKPKGCGSRAQVRCTPALMRRAMRRRCRHATSASSRRRRCMPSRRLRRLRTRSPDGAVASVMNGVGNEETLARHVARVIRGTTFPAGKLLEPGHVQWDVKGDTTFSPFEPAPAVVEQVERLADACTRGGMPAHAVADARPAQWRKVIFNAATNPIGALTGLTHGRVCERPDLRALVSGLVAEGKAVAAAQGITLDADPEELIDHAAKPEVAYGHKASMLQDVEARRPDRDRLPERRHRPLRP